MFLRVSCHAGPFISPFHPTVLWTCCSIYSTLRNPPNKPPNNASLPFVENGDESSSDESNPSPAAEGSPLPSDVMKLCGDSRPRNKARRRTATQMELLYATTGDPPFDSPPGDFSGPLLPLAEHQGGSADPGRESPSSLSAPKAGVFRSRSPTSGVERKQLERSPLTRRKMQEKATAAAGDAKTRANDSKTPSDESPVFDGQRYASFFTFI
ncbi:kinesin-like protein KIF21A, partial [Hippocampus comes]|uniref:kinesin-like protein KIF21A n=1 Tax=Hippocampus comes TaxID=109280 RepID=UPI00094E84BB